MEKKINIFLIIGIFLILNSINICIAETKTVECTYNSDCTPPSICDTKLYECVNLPTGPIIPATTPSNSSNSQDNTNTIFIIIIIVLLIIIGFITLKKKRGK